jgi:DNA primase
LATLFPEYDNPQLDAAGLVIAGDGGKRYDWFRDRVMFPIHDTRGRVIGFGGRVLTVVSQNTLTSGNSRLRRKRAYAFIPHETRSAMPAAPRGGLHGRRGAGAARHRARRCHAGTSTTPVHAQKSFRLADPPSSVSTAMPLDARPPRRAPENTLPC